MMGPIHDNPDLDRKTNDGGDSARSSGPGTTAPADTVQSARDAAEKQRHPPSENASESSQDKNPVPPESTRDR
jgi:hypothetical protein